MDIDIHKNNYKFDWDAQEFRHVINNEVLDEADIPYGVFPCPKCERPAKLESISAYGEYHKCNNCGESFTVR